jgi:hypothetical protein
MGSLLRRRFKKPCQDHFQKWGLKLSLLLDPPRRFQRRWGFNRAHTLERY